MLSLTFNCLKAPPDIQANCEDLSDRVFTAGQRCTEEKYIEKYNESVCLGPSVNKYNDAIKSCKNLTAFINEKNGTDYWDPHFCIESCSDPGYGCQACTNPSFFRCMKNNTEVCIHPELQCNHYPDCDNAEDENPQVCGNANSMKGMNYANVKSVFVSSSVLLILSFVLG